MNSNSSKKDRQTYMRHPPGSAMTNGVCRQCGKHCRKSVVKAMKRKTNPKRFVFFGFGADNRTCSEQSERNSKKTSLLDLRSVSCIIAGCKRSLPTMRIALSQVCCQGKEKKNEPQKVRFLSFGAQKATAIEHQAHLN